LVLQFNPIRAAHQAETAWRDAIHRYPCGGRRAP
jgi:hypothetical protein